MALRQLVLGRDITLRTRELAGVNAELEELRGKLAAFKTREAELEAAIAEVNDETPAEETEKLDAMVNEFAEEMKPVEEAAAEKERAAVNLQAEIDRLQGELDAINEKTRAEEKPAPTEPEKRSEKIMITREFFGMNAETRDAFFAREDVKEYLNEVRTSMSQKRAITNAGLTIPEVMLDLVRKEIYRSSKLAGFVGLRRVGGKGRQNILGAIPEAIWTEMCANLNELTLTFNQVEVDGYKVGGYVAVCNALLDDSDVALASEIVNSIGTAIGKALDKAILFGTGTKMPVGIATRLAATSAPSWWGTNDPAFTDLHSSNVLKINKKSDSGASFFTALVEQLAVAKPVYSADGLFWAMNRKTHLDILAKALAFNANAALVSNTAMMPVLGGTIVEFEDDELADYEIIGGFGGNYLLAERAGIEFASSDIPLFLADQTVYKGTARYDGKPLAGEAFVIVNYNNTDATTSKDFPEDYANTALNDLVITAAAGSAAGKTVLTVSGTIASSNPVLKYKLGDYSFETGDALPTGFETLTSGTTAITAAAGKKITVVELDGNNRIVSAGTVVSVPKTT